MISEQYVDGLELRIKELTEELAALKAQSTPVAWRWKEPGKDFFFGWTTDFGHLNRAKSLGCQIEYTAPQPNPDLMPVILWLENGCDPKEAAKELRLYHAAMEGK
jgi:hypothetical protein